MVDLFFSECFVVFVVGGRRGEAAASTCHHAQRNTTQHIKQKTQKNPTCIVLRSGAAMPHTGHLNLLCPTLPPRRSARPALPPPMLVVAAFSLPLISADVCLVGLALPLWFFLVGARAVRRRRRRQRRRVSEAATVLRRAGSGQLFSPLLQRKMCCSTEQLAQSRHKAMSQPPRRARGGAGMALMLRALTWLPALPRLALHRKG